MKFKYAVAHGNKIYGSHTKNGIIRYMKNNNITNNYRITFEGEIIEEKGYVKKTSNFLK